MSYMEKMGTGIGCFLLLVVLPVACDSSQDPNSPEFTLAIKPQVRSKSDVTCVNELPKELGGNNQVSVSYVVKDVSKDQQNKKFSFLVTSAKTTFAGVTQPSLNDVLKVDLAWDGKAVRVTGVKSAIKPGGAVVPPGFKGDFEKAVKSTFKRAYISILDPEVLLLPQEAVHKGEQWTVPENEASYYLDALLQHATGTYLDPEFRTGLPRWERLELECKLTEVLKSGAITKLTVEYEVTGQRTLDTSYSIYARLKLTGKGSFLINTTREAIDLASCRWEFEYSNPLKEPVTHTVIYKRRSEQPKNP